MTRLFRWLKALPKPRKMTAEQAENIRFPCCWQRTRTMELSDEIVINAPKERVYAALNDPEILKQCIPACEELIKQDLELIEAALQTQEKILSVQSRAGGSAARARLNDLKGLMRRLRRQTPAPAGAEAPSWSQTARSLFF